MRRRLLHFQEAVRRRLQRGFVPAIVVGAVLAVGLWLWLPAGENPDRHSDLGAALIGGAVVAFAALYLQWGLSKELAKHQIMQEAKFQLYVDLWSQLQKLRKAADDLWEDANSATFEKFALMLQATGELVENQGFLLEKEHRDQVQMILSRFEDFRYGKDYLLSLRETVAKIGSGRLAEARDDLEYFEFSPEDEIRSQIDDNSRVKEAYGDLVDEIGSAILAELEIESAARTHAARTHLGQ